MDVSEVSRNTVLASEVQDWTGAKRSLLVRFKLLNYYEDATAFWNDVQEVELKFKAEE